MIIARKIFSPEFFLGGGGTCPPAHRLLRLCLRVALNGRQTQPRRGTITNVRTDNTETKYIRYMKPGVPMYQTTTGDHQSAETCPSATQRASAHPSRQIVSQLATRLSDQSMTSIMSYSFDAILTADNRSTIHILSVVTAFVPNKTQPAENH